MNRFIAGADSIFSYLEATVERSDNGCCWKTYDYFDKPYYHYCVFNGVGGIPLFLVEYYRATKREEALELAEDALRWCIAAKPASFCHERGLQLGKTGVAYSALVVSELTGNERLVEFAIANGEHLCAEEPGPITDLLSGEASNGWFLLKLWRRTRDVRFLQGAVRCAEWIDIHIVRTDGMTYCLTDPVRKSFGEKASAGLAHGISGVAVFLAKLYDETRDVRWSKLSHELLDTLARTALEARGGLNWAPKLGDSNLVRCQYSHGACGIGLAFSAAATWLHDKSLLHIAAKAGEATYNYGDFRTNPTLCTGLAGGGELMLELYRQSNDEIWRTRAEAFGDLALCYRVQTPDGDRWPTDTPGLYSPDFTYGASGTGYFFLGVSDPINHRPPFI